MQKEDWYPAKHEPGVLGRFGYEKILDVKASREADEERYREIVCLYTCVPASKDIPPPQKVLPQNQREFIERFPEAWEAFRTGERIAIDGTPLDEPFHEIPAMAERDAQRLEIEGVQSWEQFARLSDQQCMHLGFGMRRRRDAALAAMNGGGAAAAPTRQPIEPDGGAVNGVMAASSPAAAPETEAPALPPAPRRRPGRPRKTA